MNQAFWQTRQSRPFTRRHCCSRLLAYWAQGRLPPCLSSPVACVNGDSESEDSPHNWQIIGFPLFSTVNMSHESYIDEAQDSTSWRLAMSAIAANHSDQTRRKARTAGGSCQQSLVCGEHDMTDMSTCKIESLRAQPVCWANAVPEETCNDRTRLGFEEQDKGY